MLKNAASLSLADARGSVTSSAEVSGPFPSRDRPGVTMALRAAKANEDAARPSWGQRFGAAAELPLGPELYVTAGSVGDLVAGTRTDRVFDRAVELARQPHRHPVR
jgi:hypothetical protein